MLMLKVLLGLDTASTKVCATSEGCGTCAVLLNSTPTSASVLSALVLLLARLRKQNANIDYVMKYVLEQLKMYMCMFSITFLS